MNAATYPATFAAAAIGAYQRFISPYKGFRCAYRARTKRTSCSEFAKRIALRRGLLALPGLLRERFKRCAAAARAMTHRRRNDENETRGRGRSSPSMTDGCGDAAANACVHGGCDVVGELATCDGGGVDACGSGCGSIELL